MSVFVNHQNLIIAFKFAQELTLRIAVQSARHIVPPNLHSAQR